MAFKTGPNVDSTEPNQGAASDRDREITRWIAMALGAAISATTLTSTFIHLSGLEFNAIAKLFFDRYDAWLRAATSWAPNLVYNINYFFHLELSLPDGWHNIFAVMLLKPIADAVVDGRPGQPRWLTRAYFLISGLPICLAFSLVGASGDTDDLLPIIAVACGLSLYEFFKSFVMGSIYVTEANIAKYGASARRKNIVYYLRWYTGGFSVIGTLSIFAAWQWARSGYPSPSAFGAIVYFVLLTLYHFLLACQAYFTNRADFKNGFLSNPGPPFGRLIRTKWFIRLGTTLAFALVGILISMAPS